MTERPLVDLAEATGVELAVRLRIPCDIVDIHRVNESRARIYSSLRYGAFLLAYAPLESFFTQLTGMQTERTVAPCHSISTRFSESLPRSGGI